MATDTTGSTVLGTVAGLGNGLGGGGASGLDIGRIVNVNGTPDGVVTTGTVSGVAWDGQAGQLYMFMGGSSWINLGSVSA